jgi:hypothetical protein
VLSFTIQPYGILRERTPHEKRWLKGRFFEIRRKKQHEGMYESKQGEKANKFKKGRKKRPKD